MYASIRAAFALATVLLAGVPAAGQTPPVSSTTSPNVFVGTWLGALGDSKTKESERILLISEASDKMTCRWGLNDGGNGAPTTGCVVSDGELRLITIAGTKVALKPDAGNLDQLSFTFELKDGRVLRGAMLRQSHVGAGGASSEFDGVWNTEWSKHCRDEQGHAGFDAEVTLSISTATPGRPTISVNDSIGCRYGGGNKWSTTATLEGPKLIFLGKTKRYELAPANGGYELTISEKNGGIVVSRKPALRKK
jgi:hypothetical protein